MGDAGSLLRNQALAVLTGALMSPQEMLPEVAAQAMERQFFETFVGKVGAAVPKKEKRLKINYYY